MIHFFLIIEDSINFLPIFKNLNFHLCYQKKSVPKKYGTAKYRFSTSLLECVLPFLLQDQYSSKFIPTIQWFFDLMDVLAKDLFCDAEDLVKYEKEFIVSESNSKENVGMKSKSVSVLKKSRRIGDFIRNPFVKVDVAIQPLEMSSNAGIKIPNGIELATVANCNGAQMEEKKLTPAISLPIVSSITVDENGILSASKKESALFFNDDPIAIVHPLRNEASGIAFIERNENKVINEVVGSSNVSVFSLDLSEKIPIFPANMKVRNDTVLFMNMDLTFFHWADFPGCSAFLASSFTSLFFKIIFITLGCMIIAREPRSSTSFIFFLLFLGLVYFWVLVRFEISFLLFKTLKNFDFWYMMTSNLILLFVTYFQVFIANQADPFLQFYLFFNQFAQFSWISFICFFDCLPMLNLTMKISMIIMAIGFLIEYVALQSFVPTVFSNERICVTSFGGACIVTNATGLIFTTTLVIYLFQYLFLLISASLRLKGERGIFLFVTSDVEMNLLGTNDIAQVKKFLEEKFQCAPYKKPFAQEDDYGYVVPETLSIFSTFLTQFTNNGLYCDYVPLLGSNLQQLFVNTQVLSIAVVGCSIFGACISAGVPISWISFALKLFFFLIPFCFLPVLLDQTLCIHILTSFDFFYLFNTIFIVFLFDIFTRVNNVSAAAAFFSIDESLYLVQGFLDAVVWILGSTMAIFFDAMRGNRYFKIALLLLWTVVNLWLAYSWFFEIPGQLFDGRPWYEDISVCVSYGCYNLRIARIQAYLTMSVFCFRYFTSLFLFPNATLILRARWNYIVETPQLGLLSNSCSAKSAQTFTGSLPTQIVIKRESLRSKISLAPSKDFLESAVQPNTPLGNECNLIGLPRANSASHRRISSFGRSASISDIHSPRISLPFFESTKRSSDVSSPFTAKKLILRQESRDFAVSPIHIRGSSRTEVDFAASIGSSRTPELLEMNSPNLIVEPNMTRCDPSLGSSTRRSSNFPFVPRIE